MYQDLWEAYCRNPEDVTEEMFMRLVHDYVGDIRNVDEILKAPVKRLFCEIMNHSKLNVIGARESVADYCIRICAKYELTYVENVRKYFSYKPSLKGNNKKHLELIKLYILPKLTEKDRLYIENYIISETNIHG